MTILFGLKNISIEDSIAISFANIKKKLDEYQNKKMDEVK